VTYFEAAAKARAALIEARLLPETATLDADLLARHVAGWDRETWLLRRSEPIDDGFKRRYEAVIERRLTREPVAYIRGVQEFWGRDFLVTPAVLIPRPETELLIEAANEFLRQRPRSLVVDIGTGSGCIAITLALENPAAEIFAVDISAPALEVAAHNAQRHGTAGRIQFIRGDHLSGCPRPIDLIVANPPYVSERDKRGLAPEVRDYEPAVALFGGDDGWRNIRAVLRSATTALDPEGSLMMELGYGQSERLAHEVQSVGGLALDSVRGDLQGIPRLGIISRTRSSPGNE
jgi:release factor glutamine methyltransferase